MKFPIKIVRNKPANKINGQNGSATPDNLKTLFTMLKNALKNSALANIDPWQLYRYLWTIEDWRNAIDSAENIENPDKFDLIEIFHDLIDDYSVYSSMQQRTAKVINSKLMFLNQDGTENEQIRPFFINPDGTQKPWFRRWLKIAQDVKYYGFEVAELGLFINNEFKSVGLYKSVSKIPEQNLVPTKRLIKKDARAGITTQNVISMDFSQFSPRLVPMGNENDLGLLNKAVPFVIWKYIFSNWRQHAEIFGQPFRQGRTDIYDNERINNMIKMFESMVSSSYGIFHPDDEISFIESSKTDVYNIYDKLIERCDQAIVKIFLSQTGTTDEKSFVGSADIHEGVLKDVVLSDRLDISEYFTEILIPKLKALGYINQDVNICLTWIIDERIELNQWADIIDKLSRHYEIEASEIQRIFNIDAEKKEVQTPGFNDQTEQQENEQAKNKLSDIMAKTQRYYQKLWQE